MASLLWQLTVWCFLQAWSLLENHPWPCIFLVVIIIYWLEGPPEKPSNTTHTQQEASGKSSNITLPGTGKEAIQRLLAFKEKDPYCILGVTQDASDEDIKKRYRKQALLVHPDKNPHPRSAEAFKILGHAYKLIGEPDCRREYDAQAKENQATEDAMRNFMDLLTKLRREAADLMWCQQCGGLHKRYPTNRPLRQARRCDMCRTFHSAAEGDIWAESGFLWHYYACMDGDIFDITEWASCQADEFAHMRANFHFVMYRLSTRSSRQRNSGNYSNRFTNQNGRSRRAANHTQAAQGSKRRKKKGRRKRKS